MLRADPEWRVGRGGSRELEGSGNRREESDVLAAAGDTFHRTHGFGGIGLATGVSVGESGGWVAPIWCATLWYPAEAASERKRRNFTMNSGTSVSLVA